MNTPIRRRTVKLLTRIIKPFVDEGIILISEEKEIIRNLKHLSEKGELIKFSDVRLLNQREAAEALGIGLSNFKKQEQNGAFNFKRRMVGSSVRYRNIDIFNFILSED